MSNIVRVVVKNVFEFEVADGFVLSNFDEANFEALAKQAMFATPQSLLVSDAKFKVKF